MQEQHRADHVFVAYADGIWQVQVLRSLLSWLRPKPRFQMEGILYRGGFSYPEARGRSAAVKRFLFRRLITRGLYQRLLIDDEYLYEFATAAAGRNTQIDLAVNPVELFDIDRVEARRRLGLKIEGRIVSLSGMIDSRKGADLLTHAFIQALEQGLDDITLLLAGPHREDIRSRCSSLKYSVIFIRVELCRLTGCSMSKTCIALRRHPTW